MSSVYHFQMDTGDELFARMVHEDDEFLQVKDPLFIKNDERQNLVRFNPWAKEIITFNTKMIVQYAEVSETVKGYYENYLTLLREEFDPMFKTTMTKSVEMLEGKITINREMANLLPEMKMPSPSRSTH